METQTKIFFVDRTNRFLNSLVKRDKYKFRIGMQEVNPAPGFRNNWCYRKSWLLENEPGRSSSVPDTRKLLWRYFTAVYSRNENGIYLLPN